ncbi:MAG: gliding motility-associated C-terminal domain-containing protein [Flavobacteriales bacterium]
MKHLLSFAILAFAFARPLLAQPPTTTSDCDGAIQLCGGVYTESSAPLGTGNVFEFTGTCNQNLESASLWYTFTVQDPGNLSFVLDPANDFDDYDWGLFNITEGGCAGINAQDGTSPEVNCNSYGTFFGNGQTGISTANGGTGTSNGPGDINGPPFNADLPVIVGQTYALVVMNWTGSPDGYNIDFTQSTASIYDVLPPSLVSVTPDCSNQNFELVFSEPVVTSTVTPEDATLTSPSGTVLSFSSVVPGNATAQAQTGYSFVLGTTPTEGGMYTLTITSAAGNVEDLCGNIVVDTTFQVSITAPFLYAVDIATACNGTGGSVQVNYISGGTGPFIYYLNGATIAGGSATGLEPGEYGLQVDDATGCHIFELLDIPDHTIEAVIPEDQDSLSCSHTSITIEGAQVLPEQPVQIQWTAVTAGGTDTNFSSSLAPEITQPGIYTMLITDEATGCSDEASVVILTTSITNVDLGTLLLPNVVSPNGDGHNDVWRPYLPTDPSRDITSLFDTFDLNIFDRWGQLVYETGNGGQRSWRAQDVAEGTYFYKVAFRSECGTVIDKELSGSITVLR